jgi:opacity protein-like surface antigen
MKQAKSVLTLALLLATLSSAAVANAQRANATAIQPLQLSIFGGASGVYTGLNGGRNLSVVAGVDLALPPFLGMRPTVEVRGLYPVDDGVIDSQRDILGGLKLGFLLNHRLHPYADFLFGRGQMNYSGTPGLLYNGYYYGLTTGYVYSPGAGIDYQLSPHFAIKVDGQYQRWTSSSTPPLPTPTGIIYSEVGTVGLIYIFDFNHGGVTH